jgi:hypothetical protein
MTSGPGRSCADEKGEGRGKRSGSPWCLGRKEEQADDLVGLHRQKGGRDGLGMILFFSKPFLLKPFQNVDTFQTLKTSNSIQNFETNFKNL